DLVPRSLGRRDIQLRFDRSEAVVEVTQDLDRALQLGCRGCARTADLLLRGHEIRGDRRGQVGDEGHPEDDDGAAHHPPPAGVRALPPPRPQPVCGTTSPYPTVPSVTIAHQTPVPNVGKSLRSMSVTTNPATSPSTTVMNAR